MATAAQAERPHSPIENRNLAAEKAAPEKKKTSPLTDQVDLTMTFAYNSAKGYSNKKKQENKQ